MGGMRCEECHVEAEGDAKGWEALLADLDDDGQDELVFYCRAARSGVHPAE